MKNIFGLILMVFSALIISGCGLFKGYGNEFKLDTWYPEYSYYFSKGSEISGQKKRSQGNPIIFIHGYGGDISTFQQLGFDLSDKMDRGLFYFNYEGGPLNDNSSHISKLASDLRIFLDDNIFRFNQNAKIDIVVHSTGGLVAREYIINNPLTHRVEKLALVGVPNYGAHFAALKDRVFYEGIFSGDLQAKELQHGSTMLFELQRRWECYFKFAQYVNSDGPSQGSSSQYPGCIPHSKIFPNDRPPTRSEFNHRGGFPKILSIMGTSYWDDRWVFRFSDEIVRLESGVLDERFLQQIKRKGQDKGQSEMPAVIYVKYNHWNKKGYFGSDPSRQEMAYILSLFLSQSSTPPINGKRIAERFLKTSDRHLFPCTLDKDQMVNEENEGFNDLLECYTKIREEKGPDHNNNWGIGRDQDVDVAAYWIRVTDRGWACRNDLSAANPIVNFVVENVTIKRPWLEIIIEDWTRRRKKTFSNDGWIEYQRYVSLGEKDKITADVTISLIPRKRSPEDPTEWEEDNKLYPINIDTTMHLVRGRTTMLHCWASKEECIDITGRGGKEDYPSFSATQSKYSTCRSAGGRLFKAKEMKDRG